MCLENVCEELKHSNECLKITVLGVTHYRLDPVYPVFKSVRDKTTKQNWTIRTVQSANNCGLRANAASLGSRRLNILNRNNWVDRCCNIINCSTVYRHKLSMVQTLLWKYSLWRTRVIVHLPFVIITQYSLLHSMITRRQISTLYGCIICYTWLYYIIINVYYDYTYYTRSVGAYNC